MEKTWRRMSVAIAILVLVGIGGGGCSRGPAGGPAAPPGGSPEKQGESSSAESSAGQELAEALKKRAALTSYETTMMVDGETRVQQAVKLDNGNIARLKVKTGEDGDWTLMLLDQKEFYHYSGESKTIMKIPSLDEEPDDPENAASRFGNLPEVPDLKELQDQSLLVKSDTLDGVECWSVEIPGVSEGKHRVWFDKRYGLPVRMELGETVIQYQYDRVNAVPDSEFELPAGIPVMDMEEMMKGLPQLPDRPQTP